MLARQKKLVRAHEDRAYPTFSKSFEYGIEVARVADLLRKGLEPERTRRLLRITRNRLGFDVIWIDEHGERGGIWNQVAQDCQLLARNRRGEKADTCDVAFWPTNAGDETCFDRVAANGKDNRYC